MATELTAADEVFHPANDDPDWNESGWFGFNIPERDINGFVYYFHDVRTGVSGGAAMAGLAGPDDVLDAHRLALGRRAGLRPVGIVERALCAIFGLIVRSGRTLGGL